MMQATSDRARKIRLTRTGIEFGAFAIAAFFTAQSAIVAKQSGLGLPLVAIDGSVEASAATIDQDLAQDFVAASPENGAFDTGAGESGAADNADVSALQDQIRYFDGRPVRPSKVIWMKVTAYSPDERSCGRWADGRTATNHSVWTNAMKLVAADTSLLPFGSLLSIPGYADGEIVPVLDRGGAIKGSRLDVLYPTHEIARQWGVRELPIVVWEYADDEA